MESKLESRLKNLNRIESLLTELKSTAPSFAVWRPLLQAVIELSGEFKQHVEGLSHISFILICLGKMYLSPS